MINQKERDSLLPNGKRHGADDCREEGKLSHEESETYCLSACTRQGYWALTGVVELYMMKKNMISCQLS